MRVIFGLLMLSIILTGACFADGADEDLSLLSTEELEERLGSVDKEMRELKTEVEYLRTEPPTTIYDQAEIERSGYGGAGRVKSELLAPNAEYDAEKRLKELKNLRDEIETELGERDRLDAEGGKR